MRMSRSIASRLERAAAHTSNANALEAVLLKFSEGFRVEKKAGKKDGGMVPTAVDALRTV